MTLHPPLVSANPLHYGHELTALDNLDLGSLYLDTEDSSFINNITLGMKAMQAVARQTPRPLSFHFMVARPQRWFNTLAEIRPAWVFVHAETLDYPLKTLTEIRHTDARVGLVSNPVTPTDAWRYLASGLGGVTVMTSKPGEQGQRFIPSMYGKIQKACTAFSQTECWVGSGVTLAAAQ